MKLRIFLAVVALFCFELKQLFSLDAVISVQSSKPIPGEITPLLNGIFIDYLNEFVNGSEGLWAQELYDRGFDYTNQTIAAIPFYWRSFGTKSEGDALSLEEGGYNENGEYFQRILNNSSESIQGVWQKVYVYDTVGGEFYVYLKSDNMLGKAYISLIDTTTNEVYFKQEMSGITSDWQKFEVTTSPVTNIHTVKLLISLEGEGTLDIDESSFMPLNHVGGIRKEYFDLFKEWEPGLIRYPGGFFADIPHNNWKASLSHIDKRISPNSIGKHQLQRMDYGLHEYMHFCKGVNSNPHLVVNMGSGNVQSAVELMEYCNGKVDTEFGKQRAENGYPESFNVKYWEIGNEQWENTPQMAADFLGYYTTMKAIDSSIQIMVSGNTWGGKEYFDQVFDVVGDNCDIYSYHDITPAKPVSNDYDEKQRFYSIMAAAHVQDNTFDMFRGWLNERNLQNKITMALTEYLISYDVKAPEWIDTTYKNATFEAGLWMASVMQSFFRNSDLITVFQKSYGLGHIRIGYNSRGQRIYYPSPVHTMLSFLRHNTGTRSFNVEIDCEKYSTELIIGLYQSFNVNFVDASVTYNDSTLFIAIVNRHVDDSASVKIELPFDINDIESKYYQLYNDDYDIFNSPDFPDLVKLKESSKPFSYSEKVPPHSFTPIKVPVNMLVNSVSSRYENKVLTVFPNPTDGNLNIILPDEIIQLDEIIIFDIFGNELLKFKENPTDNIVRLSTKELPTGNYFVKLVADNAIYQAKFVIAR